MSSETFFLFLDWVLSLSEDLRGIPMGYRVISRYLLARVFSRLIMTSLIGVLLILMVGRGILSLKSSIKGLFERRRGMTGLSLSPIVVKLIHVAFIVSVV